MWSFSSKNSTMQTTWKKLNAIRQFSEKRHIRYIHDLPKGKNRAEKKFLVHNFLSKFFLAGAAIGRNKGSRSYECCGNWDKYLGQFGGWCYKAIFIECSKLNCGYLGRVVSDLDFYSDDPSLNPSENCSFCCKICVWKEWK